MVPKRTAPLWFELALLFAVALVVRLAACGGSVAWCHEGGGDSPQVAFWAFIGIVAGWIWNGIQVAAKITLEILAYSVKLLWAFAQTIYNAAKAVGRAFAVTGKALWRFLRSTYENVIRPVWQHFWKWFDRARKWLEDLFRPVLRFLRFIRTWVLDFYAKWVRPILDVIGAARRVLRVLGSLGVDWARALDRRLAELEARIEAPFRALVAAINEVINIVNRVVTLDGLIQRVAMIRSVERDLRPLSRAFVNWRSRPLTDEDFAQVRAGMRARTLEQVIAEAREHLPGDRGPSSSAVAEAIAIGTRNLSGR